jgi:hypothetical protein
MGIDEPDLCGDKLQLAIGEVAIITPCGGANVAAHDLQRGRRFGRTSLKSDFSEWRKQIAVVGISADPAGEVNVGAVSDG